MPEGLACGAPASASASLARRAGSGRGKCAIVASISAPIPSDSGASRASASRTEPFARLAASAIASRLDFAPGRPERADDSLDDFGCRQGLEPQPPAARADGRQHLPWPVRDDKDQRAVRRLLDHLQQRVGAAAIEILGANRRCTIRQPPKAADSWKTCSRVAHLVDADLA